MLFLELMRFGSMQLAGVGQARRALCLDGVLALEFEILHSQYLHGDLPYLRCRYANESEILVEDALGSTAGPSARI